MKIKALIAGILMLILTGSMHAQTEVATYLQAGLTDSPKLIEAFMRPLSNVIGSDMNAGWYNTAAVQKRYGFDITFTVSAALAPGADQNFDIANLGLTNASLQDPSKSVAPSVAGENIAGPSLQLFKLNPATNQPVLLMRFNSPKGGGYPTFPLPMIKAAIGLPAGFELIGRFLPKITYNDISMTMWGLGIKYDLLQYLPFREKVPYLNTSFLCAYTNTKSASELDFQRQEYQDFHGRILPGGQPTYPDQIMDISAQAMLLSLLFSADMSVITLYGAAGYSTSSFGLKLLGDYPLIDIDNQGTINIKDAKDPVSIDFDKFSGPQFTAGIRLKVSILTLHADYTFANYPTAAVGLGLMFNQKAK
ncbi:MAG: DUF6588 family protein [Bacteroidales bacterium]|nr:DUF6588 family protein [Bacteroidales bacterium]